MKIASKFDLAYKRLNPGQKKAVDAIEGPVMVIAGPGSGKTELLSLRVMNILRNADVTPGNILCLTFTEAAAFNMRQRLAGLLGRVAYRVAIHTFHSFGVEIINRYPEHFYNGASFLPADSITQTEILQDIFNGLPYSDPLRSEHNDQFTYLYLAKRAIEYIKKAGLSPAEFRIVLAENKKAINHIEPIIRRVFSKTISKKMFPTVRAAIEDLKGYQSSSIPGFFRPYVQHLVGALTESLGHAESENSTRPLTEWKKEWVKKGNDKITHLIDFLDVDVTESLAGIYEMYASRMQKERYYDYDDMILDTIVVLQRDMSVRLDLQERYQYVLVDEFQDTNNAQMRLIGFLTDNLVNEGRPNIMVVGDDDQAIYKFQGAEISNIIDFKEMYREPTLIVLNENYRSTQHILDVARHIILKGVGRLENLSPDLKKELIASNKELANGAIYGKEFVSREAEYAWIAGEIKKLITQGISPRQIAVIAREHKDLEALVPHFHAIKIPLSYEREENVLHEPHILQLITMARFVDSIMKKSEDADNFLPEILSYPFWGVPRATIWELSLKAREERKPWLMTMREFGGRVTEIANFFIELGARATYGTAEEILHELIGGPQEIIPDDETHDDEAVTPHAMFSPFRSYYFGKERFTNHRANYMKFLSSLQSFVGSLREYRRGRPVTIGGLTTFVDIHIKNNLPINNINPFVNAMDAVLFLSAHKAKGLEFEAVFVINCQEDVWASSQHGRDIPLPMNLPINPAGDTLDDKLRLFYVAVTRAKRFLYLTSYRIDSKGKESSRLGFIAPDEATPDLFQSELVDMKDSGNDPLEMLEREWDVHHSLQFIPSELTLLWPIIEKYQLSVTHLQNFLNVVSGGPLLFFQKNLLRFPEPKSASGALGSAAHNTIRRIYDHFKNKEMLPSIKEVLTWFEEFLRDERLNEQDFKLMLKRGEKALHVFYANKQGEFSLQDKIEFDFKSQGVVVGEAHLTGKIDRMTISGGQIIVTDFKTGKAIKSWFPSNPYEKIKAWRYRQQLVFYKLLIENSRDFSNKYLVNRGIIEFVEPYRGQIVDLPTEIKTAEVRRMAALINVVYRKIKSLDFPDITNYSKDINGILAFEEDLLKDSSSLLFTDEPFLVGKS